MNNKVLLIIIIISGIFSITYSQDTIPVSEKYVGMKKMYKVLAYTVEDYDLYGPVKSISTRWEAPVNSNMIRAMYKDYNNDKYFNKDGLVDSIRNFDIPLDEYLLVQYHYSNGLPDSMTINSKDSHKETQYYYYTGNLITTHINIHNNGDSVKGSTMYNDKGYATYRIEYLNQGNKIYIDSIFYKEDQVSMNKKFLYEISYLDVFGNPENDTTLHSEIRYNENNLPIYMNAVSFRPEGDYYDYVYDKYGNYTHIWRTQLGSVFEKFEYVYIYDECNNWIRSDVFLNNKLQVTITREISYYYRDEKH